MRNRNIYIVSKVSLQEILNNSIRENSNFTVEKAGRPHLNQVWTSPPRNEAPQSHVPPERMDQEEPA